MVYGLLLVAAQIVLTVLIIGTGDEKASSTPDFSKATGLVTNRLSPREFEKWREIEQIVFAEDKDRQSIHPTLRNLWQWIETSGHTVYVEIIRLSGPATCTAGHFTIERFDPSGESHVAVIKLNLSSINQASVGPETRRLNGFIPFLGLDKKERYAEVLGHELAHAVHILTSLNRTRLVEELVQQTNKMLLSHSLRHKGKLNNDLKRRLSKRDAFLKELEDQAEEMEEVVWEELTARKSGKSKWPFLAGKQ